MWFATSSKVESCVNYISANWSNKNTPNRTKMESFTAPGITFSWATFCWAGLWLFACVGAGWGALFCPLRLKKRRVRLEMESHGKAMYATYAIMSIIIKIGFPPNKKKDPDPTAKWECLFCLGGASRRGAAGGGRCTWGGASARAASGLGSVAGCSAAFVVLCSFEPFP